MSLCRVKMQSQGMLLLCAAIFVASAAASYIQVRWWTQVLSKFID